MMSEKGRVRDERDLDQCGSNGVGENWLVWGIVLNLELMGSPVMCENKEGVK